MQVLQITNRIPFPLHDGGNLAVYNIMSGLLNEGVTVSLLSMNTQKHWVANEDFPKIFQQLHRLDVIAIDSDITIWGAMRSLFKKQSYNIQRFINQGFAKKLKSVLQEDDYDIVLLEGLFVVPYIPVIRKYSKAKIVYRQHNIEYQIWERRAMEVQAPIKKWYLRNLALRLKEFEIRHLNDYDGIASISKTDARVYQKLGCLKPIQVVPFSIHPNNLPFTPALTSPLSLYHIGAMDWAPNVEGILWFLNNIWNKIILERPDVQLFLAGRKMPDTFIKGTWKNVHVLGEVASALAFEQDKSILIVPLLSGSGIRVKILQAMAMGKAVVTTSVGLQGIIEAIDGQHILLADTPQDFAEKILHLLQHPELVKKIGENASKLIRSHYNSDLIIPEFIESMRKLLVEPLEV